MKQIRWMLTAGASVVLASGFAVAQTTTTSPPSAGSTPTASTASQPHPQNVYQRRQDQQNRIANGVQSGQLTAGETKNLEGREAGVNQEIHADKAANDGKLTGQEKQQIQHQDNNISKSIYQDKHNANTAKFGNNEVGQRRENQQDRIAQGIRSGQMTPNEAAHAEGQQQSINRQVAADRQANGGKLTGQQRQQINRRQNRASNNIYNKKHNGNRRY